jgi:hypothetical protein
MTAVDVALAVWSRAPAEIKFLAALCDDLKRASPEVSISVAPPKGMARGFTKACTDARVTLLQSGRCAHGGRAPAEEEDRVLGAQVAQLYDVARAMVECPTMEDMSEALIGLRNVCSAQNSNWEVVRVKQRFENPTAAGWSDIFVNVRNVRTKFTCELQFAHEKLLVARKGMKAHDTYAQFRGAAELLESCAEV